MTTKRPSPGSDAAIAAGCACPIIDNGHGWGAWGREGQFWVVAECHLHGNLLVLDPVNVAAIARVVDRVQADRGGELLAKLDPKSSTGETEN